MKIRTFNITMDKQITSTIADLAFEVEVDVKEVTEFKDGEVCGIVEHAEIGSVLGVMPREYKQNLHPSTEKLMPTHVVVHVRANQLSVAAAWVDTPVGGVDVCLANFKMMHPGVVKQIYTAIIPNYFD